MTWRDRWWYLKAIVRGRFPRRSILFRGSNQLQLPNGTEPGDLLVMAVAYQGADGTSHQRVEYRTVGTEGEVTHPEGWTLLSDGPFPTQPPTEPLGDGEIWLA